MTRETTRRRLLAGAGAAAATALAGCSGSTPFVGKRRERTERIDVGDATGLVVRGEVGDVTVRTEERDDVRAHVVEQASSVTADLESLDLSVERADERLTLASVYDGNASGLFSDRPSMDLDLTIPASLAVEAVETTVGDVTVRDAVGDLDAEATTGDHLLRNVDGDVAASTTTGDVDVEQAAGAVTAETNTGDVTVRDVEALGDVESNTGEVAVDVPAIDGDATIETNTGDVDAALGADLDATLRLRSDTGDVALDGVTLDDAETSDERVTGVVGDGGPTLTIEANTGDVTVTRLS